MASKFLNHGLPLKIVKNNLFWFLIVVSLGLTIVGIFLGNPFETYQTASEL